MIARLTDRFARYRANNGMGGIIWNVLILVVLSLRVMTAGNPFVSVQLGGILLAGLVLGWIILPISRLNFRLATRLISVVNWTLIAFVVIGLIGRVAIPPLVWLTLIGALGWVISASFWLTSEPGVTTGVSRKAMEREYERESRRGGDAGF